MSEHDKQTASTSQQPTSDNLNSHDKIEELHTLTNRLANELERSRIAQYTELLNRPWKLIGLNLLSGAARGVGIAIGFTFFAATIIYVLQLLGALNLPIVGDYIADIVRIVQRQLDMNTY
ncbi:MULTISPECIES: DUF5665 domain-containing protein [Paenibacillus]|uniref:DUF5665 domain-containing protein n=1 Tax=Paenibacillus TaxID=44249 RepID=UPI0003E22686|nr:MULTISPECIES: DUF5665 domain-containing protein [Paenibacillus]ETT29335.1 hypothetical protein C161_29921 [Paenibacillus sp. FSL R5-192]OMF06460.1 hypothetical protein BK129_12400 [Paenibacillus amylolyticus]PJN61815.1 hypothetical protein PAEAM_13740 [Paenibacillus sp. GM1FR]